MNLSRVYLYFHRTNLAFVPCGNMRVLASSTLYRGKYTKSKNDDDVIEAEIVGEKKGMKSESMEDGNDKSHGFLDGVMKKAGTLVGGFIRKTKEVLKMDEESVKKREQEKLLNQTVDRALQGTGIFGSIMGGIMKQGLKIAAEAAAENSKDISVIQDSVKFILENDKKVKEAVGSAPECSSPFAIMVNSSSINGRKSFKRYQLSFNVTGSKGLPAVASVNATVDDGEIDIEKIYLRKPSDGVTISVDCSSSKKRTVIDV